MCTIGGDLTLCLPSVVLIADGHCVNDVLQQITPSLLPRLFGQSLDSDVLVNIFNTLTAFYIP